MIRKVPGYLQVWFQKLTIISVYRIWNKIDGIIFVGENEKILLIYPGDIRFFIP